MATPTPSRISKWPGGRQRRAQTNVCETTSGWENADTDKDSGDISPSGRQSPMRASPKKHREIRPRIVRVSPRGRTIPRDGSRPGSEDRVNPLDIPIQRSDTSQQNPQVISTFGSPETYLHWSSMGIRNSSVAPVAGPVVPRLPSTGQTELPQGHVTKFQPQENINTVPTDCEDVSMSISIDSQSGEGIHDVPPRPFTGSGRSMTSQQVRGSDTDPNPALSQQPRSDGPLPNPESLLELSKRLQDEILAYTKYTKSMNDKFQMEKKSWAEKLAMAESESKRFQNDATKYRAKCRNAHECTAED
ncbi:hypothetical protein Plec18167_007104 [Paecilomyces lecythidis]|uniref:Uncharacterized protein n=1 Tax=Paecilomyces lecythidis TaxID=3004212 RepID=A0ABR3X727_9EURO